MSNQFGILGFGYTGESYSVTGPMANPIPLPRNPGHKDGILVFIDGIYVSPSKYTTSASTISLNTPLGLEMVMDVRFMGYNADLGV